MKNKIIKICSLFLAICLVILSFLSCPVLAETKKSSVTTSLFTGSEGITLKRCQDGVRVVYSRGAPGWTRVNGVNVYDTRKDGTELELKDFACLDDDYSVAIMLSNEQNKLQDTRGILLVYGYSGYFAIVAMDGVVWDPTMSQVLVHDTREKLGDKLNTKVKLNGSKYEITVNGKIYSVDASYMSEPDNLFYAIGIYGDGDIAGLNFLRNFDNTAFSYTISNITNTYVGEKIERFGDKITPANYGMHATKDVELRSCDQGIQFIWQNKTEGWERCGFSGAFPIDEEGLHLRLENIQGDDNYSLAVRLGAIMEGWFDTPGYLIVYGRTGNFSIVPADGELVDMNKLPELLKEKREPLGEYMDITVRMKDGKYTVTVNGKDYSFVPDTKYLTDPANIYLTFGVFCDGDIKTLNAYKNFKKKEFSYVLDNSIFETPDIDVRQLKPLAATTAFLSGEDKKFRPDDNLTRKEAIVSVASLITDRNDIEGVYSLDYKDIKKTDKNYSVYAYMQRCNFLPDFGEKLKPDTAITLSEFIDLLVSDNDVTKGSLNIEGLEAGTSLYNKVCYAVNQKIITLDGNKFDGTAKVTRGKAAEIMCKYLKVPENTDGLENKFTDVKENNPYYKYILLATNKKNVTDKKYTVKNEADIQNAIDEAIALSKSGPVNAVIELSEKTYAFNTSVLIDGSKYDNANLKITIKNKKGVTPTVTSNTDIKTSEFKKVEGKDYYSYQLPETAKQNGQYPKTRNIYLNGNMLTLARSEEYQFAKDIGDNSEKSNIWYIHKDALKGISNENLGYAELCIDVEWQYKCYLIKDILNSNFNADLESLEINDESWHAYKYFEGTKRDFTDWTYLIQNNIELLDEPGEFYYDRDGGIIYFYPYKDTDMKNSVISYPLTDKLFDLQNASGIEFSGIKFTGTTSTFADIHGFNGNLGGAHNWNDYTDHKYNDGGFFNDSNNTLKDYEEQPIACGAIYGEGCDFITVKNCVFDELGTHGVRMNYGDRFITVKGCSFTDLSMSAVSLGTHSNWTREKGQTGAVIDNNYICNIGTEYTNSPAISIGKIYNLAVTHNTMRHLPYSGLCVGWVGGPSTCINIMNCEAAYNFVEDIVNECNDVGGLYFGGANAMTTDTAIYNRIHDNYIKSNGYVKTYTGIYIDMNGSNYKVNNNVITGYSTMNGPLFIQDHIIEQATYNLVIEDNYSTYRAISTNATPDRNIKMNNNLNVMTTSELPEKAQKIMSASGQEEEYKKNIPQDETEVTVAVQEPHITLPKLGKSEENCLVFNITNNSDKEASYSLESLNNLNGVIDIHYSDESITVKPGETGKIAVSFSAGKSAASNKVMDFRVKKDNGWKMKFARVIEVTVSNAIVTESKISTFVLIGAVAGGLVLLGGAVTVFFILKRKKKKVSEEQ